MNSVALFVKKAIEVLSVIILSAMSILVFVNVVLRYGFNSSISVSEEVSRFMFVWLTFLAAVLAFNDNQHVSVDVLVNKLPAFGKRILRLMTDSLMLYCCYLVCEGSWVQFVLNSNNLAPISGLPQGITFLASVVASALIGLLLIARIAATIGVLAKGEK